MSGGASRWEVAVKVVDNFNCWFVRVAKKFKWWCVKWEVGLKVVDNVNCWFVKMGSGSQNGKKKKKTVSDGVSKWAVVVKVAYNCNCCFITWEVVLQVVHNSNYQCIKMGSGGQIGG